MREDCRYHDVDDIYQCSRTYPGPSPKGANLEVGFIYPVCANPNGQVIGKTSIKPTRNLSENVHWNEIACLARLILVVGNNAKNTVQSQLFVPEIMHLVTLIAATGHLYVRGTVWGIVTHMLHALYSLRLTDATASPEIQVMLDECCQPEGLRLFGLSKPTPTSEFMLYDPPSPKALIDDLEALTRLLLRIMETISGSKGKHHLVRNVVQLLTKLQGFSTFGALDG